MNPEFPFYKCPYCEEFEMHEGVRYFEIHRHITECAKAYIDKKLDDQLKQIRLQNEGGFW